MSRTVQEVIFSSLSETDLDQLLDSISSKFFDKKQELVLNQLKKPSLRQCVGSVDFIWEQLNTGHWKSVSNGWRQLYTLARLWQVRLLVSVNNDESEYYVKDLIKLCDLALLMGAPLNENNVAAKLASSLVVLLRQRRNEDAINKDEFKDNENNDAKRRKLSPSLFTSLEPRCFKVSNSVLPLDRHQDLSLESFICEYRQRGLPIVIEDAITDWPAFNMWSMEHFRHVAGPRLVPVEIGRRYTDNDWTQTLMTVDEFINKHINNEGNNNKEVGYLAQYPLFDQIEELREDIDILPYCYTNDEDEEEVDINVWLGPADTISPLHTDPKHNILCQVFGLKYVRLYCEDETPFLYPHEETMLNNSSRLNLDSISEDVVKNQFPDFQKTKGFETVLRAGDALYIPPKCWHFVQALTPSCSISFWFK